LWRSQAKRSGDADFSYADITKGGTVRDETKTVTIAVSHVEYEATSGIMPTLTAPATLIMSRT
jgi:elongation factor Tu